MEIARRGFLGILGAALASPMLMTNSNSKDFDFGQLNPDVIPTGFPIIDAELQGGLRRGTLVAIVGLPGSGKSLLAKTLALNASLYANNCSVVYKPEQTPQLIISNQSRSNNLLLASNVFDPTDMSHCDMYVSDGVLNTFNKEPKNSYSSEDAKAKAFLLRGLSVQAYNSKCCFVFCQSTLRSGVHSLRESSPNNLFGVINYTKFCCSVILHVCKHYNGYFSVEMIKNRYGGLASVNVAQTPQRTFKEIC